MRTFILFKRCALACGLALVLTGCGKDARTRANEARQKQNRQRMEQQQKLAAQANQQLKAAPASPPAETFPSVEKIKPAARDGAFEPAE